MDEKNQCFKLLDLLGRVLDANKGAATEREWYAEGLANKFFDHAFFVLYLSRGSSSLTLPSRKIAISGVASIDVLVRAAFEALLTFNYVFHTPQTDEEKDYRYWAYRLAGLMDRQNFPVNTDKQRKVLAAEKKIIEELTDKLRLNAEFQRLNDGQQKVVLGGTWRLKSWRVIAEGVGLSKILASHSYSHLCGVAHSSSLSVLQIKQAYEKHEEKILIASSITVLNILTANVIREYCGLFEPSKKTLESDPQGATLVDCWIQIGCGG